MLASTVVSIPSVTNDPAASPFLSFCCCLDPAGIPTVLTYQLLLLSLLLLAWYCRLWSCWGLCCLASKLLQAAQLLLCPTVAAIFADVPTVAGVLGTLLLQLFCCWCPYRCEIPAVAGTACVCYTHCSIPADPSGPHIKA